MQSATPPTEMACTDPNRTSYLRVLIAYQDLECSQRALNAFESLVAQLGNDYVFTHTTWKFDLFQFPKMREMASKDALDADIILICAREEDPMPDELEAWIREWAPIKTNQPSALVALFEQADSYLPVSNEVRLRLQEVAEQASMAFFSETLDFRETEIDCLKELSQHL